MKSFIRHAALAAVLAGTASTTALVFAVPAEAARAPEPPKGPTIGAKVGKPLIEGQKAFNAKDYATALAKAQEADAVENKTPYEAYQVAKLIAVIYLNQNNLPAATEAFNRAIATGGLPEEEKASTYKTAMLLNYNAKNYPKAVEYGGQAGALDDQGNLVLTQSYYFANDFAGAEKFAQSVIAAKKAAGAKPDRALLDTLLNAQLKQNKNAEAQNTLGEIALADPTPENWTRLIDQGFVGPKMSDAQVINLLRLKMRTNSMTAQDYLAMAGTSLRLGLATEAKETLQKGIAAGTVNQAQAAELMGQANVIAAKEAASVADFQKAAAAAKDGETDVKLGETLWELGRKPEAEAALRKGIEKGGLKDLANAQLLLGIVLLDNGKKDEAMQLFQQASQSPSLAASARAWSVYAQRPTA
jgi:tetratricopeptide (TPR) repeat protein